MRRKTLLPLAIGFVVAFVVAAASTAIAGNVHFKKPAPTFKKNTDNSVTATLTLAGLGNGDIRVKIDASGTGTATCHNPGKKENDAPGQNPVAVNVGGIADFSAGQITNGNLGPVTATTAAPTLPTPKQAGCPNDSWTVTGLTVSYTSVTLSVFQDDSGQNGVFNAPGSLVLGPVTFTVSL